MQNSGIGPVSPPLPPPLPPNSAGSARSSKSTSEVTECKYLQKKSVQADITSALRHITYLFYNESPTALVSFYKPICPIVQEGRCCGIVALSMASQLIHKVCIHNILEAAKELNFTKEGELFSAYNVATLASSLLNCEVKVISDVIAHKEEILHHISEGWPLLIPYDADKNHFPCSNKGHSAHWAVITGLCFTVSEMADLDSLSGVETITEFPELKVFSLKDGSHVKTLLTYATNIFLYAHQGKSKHLGAWNFNDLVLSNRNLYEVTKKYSCDDLVLPSGDALSELRDKAVLLKKFKE